MLIISTHTLTWSVTQEMRKLYMNLQDFNSHAHVERDIPLSIKLHFRSISTHTLTWSVTNTALRISLRYDISTHTLTWSVTTHFTTLTL